MSTPKVTASLISSLAGATAYAGHVRLASGADAWFGTTGSPAVWVLGSTVTSPPGTLGISAADLARLQGGTAQTDGTFNDASGARWKLVAFTDGSGVTWVVSEVGPNPDPG